MAATKTDSDSAATVFVSYSNLDKKALKTIETHFAPLVREGLARLWSDTGIDFGVDWDREIATALRECRFVVPVLSANFFASSYIAEKEIPVMLERQAAGELTIVPIFWGWVAEPEFDQVLPSGEIQRRKLSDWQGLGRPTKPLEGSERARIDSAFAEWITGLRRQLGKPAVQKRPATFAPVAEKALEVGRVDLWIELERVGDQLEVRYRRQARDRPFAPPVRLHWPQIAPELAAIHEALDSFRRDRFEAWFAAAPQKVGARLRELLFGDEISWAPLLGTLFETNRNPTFTYRKVDLTIVAKDRELAALPWRLLAFNDRFLTADGWTVRSVRQLDAGGAVQTLPTGEVLLVVAGEDGGFAERMALFFREAWNIVEGDGRLILCRSARELRAALLGMQPYVMVMSGQTQDLALVFPDGAVPCRELESALGVKAVVWNCRGLARYESEAAAPFQLWPRFDEPGPEWGRKVEAFFASWLLEGLEPVRAFHLIVDDADRGTHRLLAEYDSWQVSREFRPDADERDLLDRINQKSRVLRECQQLGRPGGVRRVLALLAHAGPNDGLEKHDEQLLHMLETEAPQLAIKAARLPIPEVRQDLRRDLEDLLMQLVDVRMNASQVLRALGPRGTGDKIPILWLSCGFVEGANFSLDELKRWIAFVDEFLLPSCPADLRIVVYLGLLFERDSLEGADESLTEFETGIQLQRGSALVVLPRLHDVPVKELVDFLREHTTCPEPARVARLIHDATGGRFEPTLEKIRQGKKGWLTLLADLEHQTKKKAARPKGW